MSSKQTSGQSVDPVTTEKERRVWVRHPCQLDGFCQPPVASGSLQWAATLQNLSPGGIALIVDRRFELGALLSIELQQPTGTVRTLMARVVRVTKKPSGRWLLGCSLARKLTDDDVNELLYSL